MAVKLIKRKAFWSTYEEGGAEIGGTLEKGGKVKEEREISGSSPEGQAESKRSFPM
jgi:hypothetical protein